MRFNIIKDTDRMDEINKLILELPTSGDHTFWDVMKKSNEDPEGTSTGITYQNQSDAQDYADNQNRRRSKSEIDEGVDYYIQEY